MFTQIQSLNVTGGHLCKDSALTKVNDGVIQTLPLTLVNRHCIGSQKGKSSPCALCFILIPIPPDRGQRNYLLHIVQVARPQILGYLHQYDPRMGRTKSPFCCLQSNLQCNNTLEGRGVYFLERKLSCGWCPWLRLPNQQVSIRCWGAWPKL